MHTSSAIEPLSTDPLVNWRNTTSCAGRSFKARTWGLVPGTSTALLTSTSKMPGPSWSLPAGKRPGGSCPGARGSICGGCYAQKGMYRQNNVKRAQQARLVWTITSSRTAEGREVWARTMADAILASGFRYFRWHDSGDIVSPVYGRMIAEVIRRTPTVQHWIPTRTYELPWAREVLSELAQLPNATVRPSAYDWDAPAPEVEWLHAGSTASATTYDCPASEQNGHCGDCRRCWTDKSESVSYHKH